MHPNNKIYVTSRHSKTQDSKIRMYNVCVYVPVNGQVVLSFIGDSDDQCISIIDLQRWAGKLAVHGDGPVCVAQPLHWACLNLFPQTQSKNIRGKKNRYQRRHCVYVYTHYRERKNVDVMSEPYNELVLMKFGGGQG